jgi:hypothetical protein
MEPNIISQVEETAVKRPKIKKHLTKPVSRRRQRKIDAKQHHFERVFEKRRKKLTAQGIKKPLVMGALITLGMMLVFRSGLNIDLSNVLEHLIPTSYGLTLVLIGLSIVVLFKDQTGIPAESDPITDFFIINKGRVHGSTLRRHFNRINTRFMMVTFLKLYQKEEIAIVDERIIYGAMEADLSKDEIALVNFMLDHGIRTIDDFIEVIREDSINEKKKDQLYAVYKNAVIAMADDKKYVNQSINKAKMILRAGAVLYTAVVLLLMVKGQGDLYMLSIYSLQALILYLTANVMYANSSGAHERIRQLKKERRLLQSNKVEIYTALVYNYLFGKEQRVLRRIQKDYQTQRMSQKSYQKFSETYNGFNYILNILQNER